ncbi:MAG: Fic family protein [Lachnospiraceae bacterium]|jgi:Fic family protein|nr:Fic family protein [Lachnospiraceae bacterium]MCI1327539.1 Fic family protein [Lachnospiraceae bacterium]
MRAFDYKKEPEKLLTPEVVRLLTEMHEYKGKQSFLLSLRGGDLVAMRDTARKESAETASGGREQRYLACLDRIREHFNEIAITPEEIASLHAELCRGEPGAGRYKTTDQVITEIDHWGKPRVRFYPMAASQTAEAMEALCASFSRALDDGLYDPLMLIPVFVVDFLSIHPFTDGNGRVSRLLQTLLLYQAGYYVNAYVSMEKLIGNSKERYFQALQYSSIFWNDGTNNYEPFVLYFLEILGEGCREFEIRTHYLYGDRKSKPERVREVIDRWPGAVTKRDIMEQCPDISRVTVERALTAMVKEGYIGKTGGGPKTAYIRRRQT